MKLLSVARLVGEAGLVGGTIAGGASAYKWSEQVKDYKKNKLKGHSDLKNVMTNSYLVSRYLTEKNPSIDVDLKKEVEEFTSCVFEYIADATNPNCIYEIHENNSLQQKLAQLGIRFGS